MLEYFSTICIMLTIILFKMLLLILRVRFSYIKIQLNWLIYTQYKKVQIDKCWLKLFPKQFFIRSLDTVFIQLKKMFTGVFHIYGYDFLFIT